MLGTNFLPLLEYHRKDFLISTDPLKVDVNADVFILTAYQGQGLGKWLISCILGHPELKNIRKWMLHTRDAHGLYQQFGFNVGSDPETYMVYCPQGNES